MGYAELFEGYVLPIIRARRDGEGNYDIRAGRWAGTGFTFGQGTFVTCWHCVSVPLAHDEVFIVAPMSGGFEQRERTVAYELRDLARDTNKADLALATIDFQMEPKLTLAREPLQWGDDVIAFGFPFTLDIGGAPGTRKNIQTRAAVFKGYVTRHARDEWDHDIVVELDMRAPAGMSGAPLFRVQRGPWEPFECAGVVFAERMSSGASGSGDELIPSSLPFAYAVRLDTLRVAAGPATSGLPLADFLAVDDA